MNDENSEGSLKGFSCNSTCDVVHHDTVLFCFRSTDIICTCQTVQISTAYVVFCLPVVMMHCKISLQIMTFGIISA